MLVAVTYAGMSSELQKIGAASDPRVKFDVKPKIDWERLRDIGRSSPRPSSAKYDPAVLAHELGHGRVHRRLGKAYTYGGKLGVPVATLGGSAALSVKGHHRAASLVDMAGALPTLGDEAAASILAIKALRKRGKLSKAELSAAKKRLALAWGSYAAPSGVAAGAHEVNIRTGGHIPAPLVGIPARMIGKRTVSPSFSRRMLRSSREARKITKEEAKEFSKKVAPGIPVAYEKNPIPIGAAYSPGFPKVIRSRQGESGFEEGIRRKLGDVSPEGLKTFLEGGVVMAPLP